MTVIDCLNDPDETLKRKVRNKMISRRCVSSIAMRLFPSLYFCHAFSFQGYVNSRIIQFDKNLFCSLFVSICFEWACQDI